MTRRALTNAAWGFSSMCFVCEEANEHGMRIPFFHDDEGGTVTADFTLGEAFSGAPTLVHGGILMALCDEAMCWASIAVAETWALTAGNTHRFLRPVRLHRPYRVEARIVGRDQAGVHARAVITSCPDADGSEAADGLKVTGSSRSRVAVEAEAVFSPIGSARAADAIGGQVASAHRRYLTGGEGTAGLR